MYILNKIDKFSKKIDEQSQNICKYVIKIYLTSMLRLVFMLSLVQCKQRMTTLRIAEETFDVCQCVIYFEIC